jgi:hypothetical protein
LIPSHLKYSTNPFVFNRKNQKIENVFPQQAGHQTIQLVWVLAAADYCFLKLNRGSSFLNSLLRLDLCRKMANTVITRLKISKIRDFPNNQALKGKLSAAAIEEREIMRKIRKTANQTKTARPNIHFTPSIFNARPSSTPRLVATPLPPLKRRKIVQLCPQIQQKPKIIRSSSADMEGIFGIRKSANIQKQY